MSQPMTRLPAPIRGLFAVAALAATLSIGLGLDSIAAYSSGATLAAAKTAPVLLARR